jgi:hypothetical protein
LDILRRVNSFPVIPISGTPTSIKESVYISESFQSWRDGDLIIYSWFPLRPFDAHRYIYIEWDCLATCPLIEYFGDLWNADAVGGLQTFGKDKDWYWWNEIGQLPESLRLYATGIAPLNCILLSHKALSAICARSIPKNVFSELRIATLLTACGITIKSMNERSADNSWHPSLISVDRTRASIYHPVKSLVDA